MNGEKASVNMGKHTHIYPPDTRRPKAFRHPIVISAQNKGKESQTNAKNG